MYIWSALRTGNQLPELNAIATAGVNLNKMFTDLYLYGISPAMPEGIEPTTRTLWHVFWSFNLSMWPHDAGHWARARQVGGNFVIEAESAATGQTWQIDQDGNITEAGA